MRPVFAEGYGLPYREFMRYSCVARKKYCHNILTSLPIRSQYVVFAITANGPMVGCNQEDGWKYLTSLITRPL